jgi:CTP:molybdopterin cytidylyltransferase MocA
MVCSIKGLVGVTDLITVKPPVSPEKVQAVIEDAFEREAEIERPAHQGRTRGLPSCCSARPGPDRAGAPAARGGATPHDWGM